MSMSNLKNSFSHLTSIVLGSGRMGQRFLQLLKELEISVVAVNDPRRESLEAGLKLTPQAEGYSDAAELFRRHSAPLVIVASTATSHAELTVLAAEHGAKFIVCEKPMAVSLAQAEEMIACCKKHGVQLAVNHQMRFMPQYVRLKEFFASPEFGRLSSMTTIAGNFGITMNGSHYIEALRYVSGSDPVEVTAWLEESGAPNPRGAEFVEKAGCLRVTTASGVRLYVDCSGSQGHGIQTVYGSQFGQLVVDEMRGALYGVCRQGRDRDLPSTRIGTEPTLVREDIEPVEVMAPTREVLCALLEGRSVCGPEEGLLILRTLVAAYLSDEQGHRCVKLSEDLPRERLFPWA